MPAIVRQPPSWRKLTCVIAVAATAQGCGANLATVQLSMPEGSEPAFDGSREEIYSRLARGMLGCWFGANGLLKPTHIFHADLPPADKGGTAEIVIHERDQLSGNPRGLKSMRILLVPRSETSTGLQFETVRFPGETGDKMRASVKRWAAGKTECDAPTQAGWQPVAQTKPTPPSKPKAPENKK